MSDTAASTERGPGGQPPLKRVMGTKLLLLFIVGDILGTGVYALTGDVAAEVGGAAWAPFLVAFIVATLTAFAYMELVTKYPQAAGAALYTHKAFGIHFVTFLVAFAVMSSGITSASTASRSFAANLAEGVGLDWGDTGIMFLALGFMTLVALINLRGVGESVKFNVFLTLVELLGLLAVIVIGFIAIGGGNADFSRVTVFDTADDKSAFIAVTAATTLAFFAMVGFEDSVNMAEETTDPTRTFPRALFTGIAITGVVYMLVAFVATALVPLETLARSTGPLLEVVRVGAAWFPLAVFSFIALFAVSNSALINMMMASRLVYGMAREGIIPGALGLVHPLRQTPWVAIVFTSVLAIGLASYGGVENLGGTTALLLLCVFALVNAAVLVLRRHKVEHEHYRAPTIFPVLGVVSCAYLASPWSGRDVQQYRIAGVLLAIGLVLWAVNRVVQRRVRGRR